MPYIKNFLLITDAELLERFKKDVEDPIYFDSQENNFVNIEYIIKDGSNNIKRIIDLDEDLNFQGARYYSYDYAFLECNYIYTNNQDLISPVFVSIVIDNWE